MNNKIFICLMLLLSTISLLSIVGSASSQDSIFSFEANTSDELEWMIVGRDELPQTGANCSIDIVYPNGTLAVNDGKVTDQGNGYYNRTINYSILGTYNAYANCTFNEFNGTIELTFRIIKALGQTYLEDINDTLAEEFGDPEESHHSIYVFTDIEHQYSGINKTFFTNQSIYFLAEGNTTDGFEKYSITMNGFLFSNTSGTETSVLWYNFVYDNNNDWTGHIKGEVKVPDNFNCTECKFGVEAWDKFETQIIRGINNGTFNISLGINELPYINIDSIISNESRSWFSIGDEVEVNYTVNDTDLRNQNCTLLDENLTLKDTFASNFTFIVNNTGDYIVHCYADDYLGQSSASNKTLTFYNGTCGVHYSAEDPLVNAYLRYDPYSRNNTLKIIRLYYRYNQTDINCANSTFWWNGTPYQMYDLGNHYAMHYLIEELEDVVFNVTANIEGNESTQINLSGRINVKDPFSVTFQIWTGEAMNYSDESTWKYVNNDAYIVAFNTSLNCSPWWSLHRYDIAGETSGCWFHGSYVNGIGQIELWENVTYIFYLVDNTEFNSSWSPPRNIENLLEQDVYHFAGNFMSFNFRDAFGSVLSSDIFYPLGILMPEGPKDYTYYVSRTELNVYSWLSEKFLFVIILLLAFAIFGITFKYTSSTKMASLAVGGFLSLAGVMTLQIVW